MKSDKISVIVTTRNRKYEVKRALDSVYAQTMQPMEVILVDDGSEDGTRDYIESFAYENLHYLYNRPEKKHSAGHSRNLGIQAARGEYIAFLDSDDVWYPQKLEIFSARLEELAERADIVYSQYKKHIKLRTTVLPEELACAGEWREEALLHNLTSASATIYRKEYMESIGLFDEEMTTNTDWELLLRGIHQKDTRIIKIDMVLSENWTMHDGVAEQKSTELKERLQLFARYLDEIEQTGNIGSYYKEYLKHPGAGMTEEELELELIRACGSSPERIYGIIRQQKCETEKWLKEAERKNSFYQLMCSWMQLKLSGNSIAGRLAEAGCRSIAIYGAGKHGKLLYEDLKGSQVSVEYFIDKQKKEILGRVPVYTLEEKLPGVDAVIVTPYLEFASIQASMQDKEAGRLIPLNTLVQP